MFNFFLHILTPFVFNFTILVTAEKDDIKVKLCDFNEVQRFKEAALITSTNTKKGKIFDFNPSTFLY